MTAFGAASDAGSIFKIQISNNAFTKMYDFDMTNRGGWPLGSLIFDGTYLYGMTTYGAASDAGSIFKIQTSNNAFTKMFDFGSHPNGSEPQGDLFSDGTYLYGMTTGGGTNGVGTIFKIQISNNAFTKIYDFDGTNSGSKPYGALISDGT
jgi:uncharacterized repeat protein (TIGR03803 family)